jgi:4-amino-4-deoxy-L-arabinose transferase-like glycosyltransferase
MTETTTQALGARALSGLPSRLAGITPGQAVVLLICLSTMLRVVFASAGGLGFDESYMVGNSRIFALSYVDHPPLHVWLVGAWAHLWSSENPLLLRLPFIALFAGSTWLMFRLGEQLFDAAAGFWSALVLNLAPVFALAHGSWILPDGPLIFFTLATANVVAHIVFRDPPRAWAWWLLAGVLEGLGLLSKYHAAFVLVEVFVFLVTVPSARKWIATPWPWIAVAIALVIFSPVIVWNLDNHLVGLAFQAKRLDGPPTVHFGDFFRDLGGQILYLTPLLFFPLAYVLGRALVNGPRASRTWFLALLAIGPIAFFNLAALAADSQFPHWPMPGWLFTIPLLGAEVPRWATLRPRLVRALAAVDAAFLVAIFAALSLDTQTGWIGNVLPAAATADPTSTLLDWTSLKASLGERGLLPQGTILAGPFWMWAGKLNYALGRDFEVLCLCEDPQNFAFLYDLRTVVGKDVLIAAPAATMDEYRSTLAPYFDSLEPLPATAIERNGTPVIPIALLKGHSLHIPPPSS